MNKLFWISTFLITSVFAFAGKDGYKIKFEVEGLADSTVQLAYYFGDNKYLSDSAVADGSGKFIFEGDEKLDGGIYLVVLPQGYFEIIVADNQHFSMETKVSDLIGAMEVKGSEENAAFYRNMKSSIENQKKIMSLKKRYDGLKKDGKHKKAEEVRKEIAVEEKAMKERKKQIVKENPNLFISKVFIAMDDPEIPEPPKDKDGNVLDSAFQYKYYKAHYWDNFDLQDDRMIRTPLFDNKFKTYMEKLTLQMPDSIIASADRLLKMSEGTEDIFKYILIKTTNKYANSKIMGMDAVYVHMIENYYLKGKASWTDSTTLFRLEDRAKSLKNILIGKKAPSLEKLFTTDNRLKSLSEIDADYTIIYIWDPECGHCKKVTPKLKNVYDSLRADGYDVEIFAVGATVEQEKWLNYIKDNKLNWINVWDPYNRTDFRTKYDINSTPQIFILDKEKYIIAKKLGVDQVEDFIFRIEQQEKRKKTMQEAGKSDG